ncbi:magnesium transporter CorA family protein [Cytobacillus massiliigabonensis]|uniref:magnesium transporter CorA family protein n=1 Tax=Cytobacillus massiliigabonensis TaxID=1871011 RepID=UPI0015E0F71B|nr:magnesium transporter CorA family protein [Cytobacillus massiliigabonensis]
MQKSIGVNQWKWVQLDQTENVHPHLQLEEDDPLNKWLKEVHNNNMNCIRVDYLKNGEKAMKGSLIYKQNFEAEEDFKIFHFYLTSTCLITINLDFHILKQINLETFQKRIELTENAVDGFLLFLGDLMNEMLVEIDQFEEALKQLIWSIRTRNGTGILEQVFNCRHELFIWKNLFIPINELKMAIDEMNFQESRKGEIFSCTCKRIERALVLLDGYEREIDSIINLEEVISSHRGNEIMKTLTVITTIFTPIMALGALWGMNFKHMPELEWKFGYILSIILIVFSTFLLYAYLKVKGWTGDLLKGKKKGSFFK